MRYYHFSATSPVSSHSTDRIYLAQDTADDFGTESDMAEMLVRAKVQSGDYLVTLVTEMERIVLLDPSGTQATQLQPLISELTYIDEHYELMKRSRKNCS
jgi:uncharacterized protein YcgI (DUF1989 family)